MWQFASVSHVAWSSEYKVSDVVCPTQSSSAYVRLAALLLRDRMRL